MREKDLVLETVSMLDVLRDFAGVEGKHRRLDECPINGCAAHDGFAYTDRVFHCFVCGAKGNVIGFVMNLLRCNYQTAVTEINKKYRLWPDDGMSGLSEKELFAIQRRAERRRQERRKLDAAEAERLAAVDELNRLDANKIKFAPKRPGDSLDPRYVEACVQLPTQEYIVGTMGGDHGRN